MAFTTYENRRNLHITIHIGGCRQVARHGKRFKYSQTNYRQHETYQQAHEYARQTALPVIICSFCKPADP